MSNAPPDATFSLAHLRQEHERSFPELIEFVYKDLRRLAAHYLNGERAGHTLQPTALVHEAYIRLKRQNHIRFESRAHFLGIAAYLMRQILVEYARAQCAVKRSGKRQRIDLEEGLLISDQPCDHIIALHEALLRLAQLDPRQSRIVELRFFGGLNDEETAAALGVSRRTVHREWTLAKTWLYHQLTSEHRDDP